MSTVVARIAFAAVLAAVPLGAWAQVTPTQQQNVVPSLPAASAAAPGRVPRAAPYMRALRSLQLSDDQRAQIGSIVREHRLQNAGADRATRRAGLKEMRQEIAGVLTPEQRKLLRARVRALRRGAG